MRDRLVIYALLQALITLALLIFAYVLHEDNPQIATLVVGAVIGQWLSESQRIARDVSDNRKDKENIGG